MKRATRLKSAEYKKIIDNFRIYLPKNLHQDMAKLIEHLNWLENDRLLLERELAEVRNAKLFDKPIMLKTTINHFPIKEGETLNWGESYYQIIQEGRGESLFKQSSRSKEEIIKKANEWAKENNKPLIPMESPKD